MSFRKTYVCTMCRFEIEVYSRFPYYIDTLGHRELLSVTKPEPLLRQLGYTFGGYKYKEYCKTCAKMVDIYRQDNDHNPWVCPECCNESIVQHGDTCPECDMGIISADESRNVHFNTG